MNNRLQIEKEVKDVIERDNLPVPPEFVIGYWSNKNWKTKKAHPLNLSILLFMYAIVFMFSE